jgi:hypothetical protein
MDSLGMEGGPSKNVLELMDGHPGIEKAGM